MYSFRFSTRSLTLRLALLFVTLSTLILMGLGLFLRQEVERHFQELDAEELHARLRLARRVLARTPAAALADLAPRLEAMIPAAPEHHLTVLDATGRPVFSNAPDLPRWLLEKMPAALEDAAPPTWRVGPEEESAHAHSVAFPQRGVLAQARSADGQMLTVALTLRITHHQHFIAGFMRSLAWALAFAILANLLCAIYAARRGLRPLEAMARLARRVSGKRLHERMDVACLPAELAPLGQDLNAMLDRLEEAFARLSGFASDIAHELRTPVTILTTQAQVALARARSPEEYREALYSSLEECERLSRMIGDMLFLAQAENGLMLPSREAVALPALLRALVEFYGLLAEEKSVRLVVTGEAEVMGDPLMLRRALGNLISNAIRHTDSGGEICIRLQTSPEAVLIRVENPGETIPPQSLERIFERFGGRQASSPQTEENGAANFSRQAEKEMTGPRQAGGTGLGLAIARSIAIAHGGSLEAASANGLTHFTLRLPHSGDRNLPSPATS
ncbi:MAG: heavy metal sensor histidine kinase [Zoogloeaceae bacterium]|jgi:two-component system heavy metal sensor histidine kinase CusS|nr:heavy metal sensor histidine kinase [Zoogloeaceae bacterium]